MFTGNFSINDVEFALEQASLEYISSIPPQFEWDKRGFKASSYSREESENTQDEIKQKIIEESKSKEFQNKLNYFKQKTLTIYQQLRNNNYEDALGPFVDKTCYFILGVPRTGGTYLLKELFKIENEKLKTYNKKMTGDHMPEGNILVNIGNSEKQTRQGLYSLAQWIYWIRQELAEMKYLVKKHIGFSQTLSLIDSIFGENSTYLVTHRHPSRAFSSYLDRFHPNKPGYTLNNDNWKNIVLKRSNCSESEWNDSSREQKFLLYWASSYLEIASHKELKGTVKSLRFGSEHEKFITNFASSRGIEHVAEPFEPTKREIGDYWQSPEAKKMIGRVNNVWQKRFDTVAVPDIRN